MLSNIMTEISRFMTNWFWPILTMIMIIVTVHIGWKDLVQSRENIKKVTIQNPDCIFLEKSDLGDGQYYMMCGETIVVRLVE